MSAPSKLGRPLPDLHNFCRFCGSNQKTGGTLQHVRNIFQSSLPKKTKTSGPTIADTLRSLGISLSEQDFTKSHRVCEKCYRQVIRIQESLKTLEKWRAQENEENEGCKDTPMNSPALGAGKKRTLTPSKTTTPRDPKKRMTKTPTKTAVTPQLGKKMIHLPARTSVTKVTINYPSNPGKAHTHPCVPEVAGIVENLAKGNLGTSAKLIMHNPTLTSHIMEQLKEKAKAETTALLATSPSPSILRKTTPQDLQNFNYSDMEAELKARAPLLHTVLSTISHNSTTHTCVSASVAIRGREPRMSALAYVIDSILQYGGAKKSALEMLSKMGICTNHKNSVAKQHQMCQSHDETVMEWKRDMELFANNTTSHPTDSMTPLPANSTMDSTTSLPANSVTPLPTNSAVGSTTPFAANSATDSSTPLPANSTMDSTTSLPANSVTPLPTNSAVGSTTPFAANSATDSSTPLPANSTMDSTTSLPANSVTPLPANSAVGSTTPFAANSATDSSTPLPANSTMDSTTSLPANSVTPLPANSATDSSTPLPANSTMDSTTSLPANSATPLPANSAMDSVTPLHANSAVDSTTPFAANSVTTRPDNAAAFNYEVTDEEMAMLGLGNLSLDISPLQNSISSCPPPGYSIIFDNLNFFVKAHHQTNSQHNRMLNWTHHMAVQHRVNPHHLPNNGSTKPLPDLNLDEVLPTHLSQQYQRRENIVMFSRIITRYLPAFHQFSDVVVAHIPHQYSEEMGHKSVEVPLGLLFKDENKTGDLVDILLHLQNEYVPRHDGDLLPIFAGGDRLSEGNSRNIQWAFAEGDTREDRLEGLVMKFEDWHAIRNLYQIHYTIFYSEKSAREHGSMCSNMNKLRATNAKKGPHQDFNAYKEFVDKEIDGIVLDGVMDHFGMETMEDLPKKNGFPGDVEDAGKEAKREWLYEEVGHIVDTLVMLKEGEIVSNVTGGVRQAFAPQQPFQCRHPGCPKTYRYAKTRNNHEVRVHNLNILPDTPAADKPEKSSQEEDHKRNYTLARLSFGLLLRNMKDAVKEGDGERLQRLYSFALLYYRAYGHTQYAYSCFLMKVQVASILSPHMSHSLVWNRFFNRVGGKGQNISLDLRLEHLNNFLKSFLKNMGPNLNENTAARVSRSLHCLKVLMDNQNTALGRRGATGYHHMAKVADDVKVIVDENRNADLLSVIPGRSFEAFPSFKRNLLHKIKYTETAKWMKANLKTWNKHYHTDL